MRPIKMWSASAWRYQVAAPRQQKGMSITKYDIAALGAAAAAAALHARQAEVCVGADAASPEVALGYRFRLLDRSIG